MRDETFTEAWNRWLTRRGSAFGLYMIVVFLLVTLGGLW